MRRRLFRQLVPALLAVVWAGSTLAQQSTSYRLKEWTFNGGGNPANGTILASTSYKIRLDAIGDTAFGVGLASATYRGDTGLAYAFPPPGEVLGLKFTNVQTLSWNFDRSVGEYELYRDPIDVLASSSTGACSQLGLTSETATDAATPPGDSGWFYLVTARNRLAEEGTKGNRSNGTERSNPAPCP